MRLRPLEVDSIAWRNRSAARAAGVRITTHDDGELVAAYPEDFFPRARPVLEHARDGDEHPIADGVAAFMSLISLNSSRSTSTSATGASPLVACSRIDSRCSSNARRLRRCVSGSLRASAWLFASLRRLARSPGGDVGERADEVVVEVELDVGGHDDQQHAEALAVGEQGHGSGGAARNAVRPIEVDQLAAARSRPSCLPVGAAYDPRRLARPGVGLRVGVRAEHTGRHELRLRREVDSRQASAGQLARLASEKADRALLAERAGERVREAKERLARALQRALELPQGCALDDERRGPGLEHPLDGLLVDRGPVNAIDPGLRAWPRESAVLPRRRPARACAMSMSTTSGSSSAASVTAVSPSAASPTISISG